MTNSWMIVAGFLFATMAVFVKLGSEQFGVAELAFYRSVVTLLVCPSNLPITGSDSPAAAATDAYEWRRS